MFALPAQAERWFILSDLHLTAGGDEALAEAVVEASGGYDALLVLGDLANSGRPAEHDAVAAMLGEIARRAGIPVYVVPGNHDLSGGISPEEFALRYDAFGYDAAFSRDPSGAGYALMAGQTCLLALDVNGYDAPARAALHGAVREETLRWMRAVLDSLPDGTRVLCCGHYPILPAEGGASDSTLGAPALCALLLQRHIPLYLCGHRHSNYTLHDGSLRQISVGVPFSWPAWCGTLVPEGEGWHYRVVSLYREDSPAATRMKDEAIAMTGRMAVGSLAGTAYEGNAQAVSWFVRAFMANLSCTLNDIQPELLADDGRGMWEAAEVRSLAKPWILQLVAAGQEDVRDILIP